MNSKILMWFENAQQSVLLYWQNRSLREKTLLIFLGILLFFCLFYLLLWQNIFVKNKNLLQKKEELIVFQNWLNTQNETVLQATQQGQRSARLDGALLRQVLQGVAINTSCKLDTGSAKQARLNCDSVEFDGLLRWLNEMNRQYSVYTMNAEIEPASPGKVHAKLILAWD